MARITTKGGAMSEQPELRIGSFLPSQVSAPENTVIRAARADERGFYQIAAVRPEPDGFDVWVSAGILLATTAQTEVIVDEVPLPEPGTPQWAGLVGAAASATLLSGGRFALGVAPAEDADPTWTKQTIRRLRTAIQERYAAAGGAPQGFLATATPPRPDPPIWVCGTGEAALAAAADQGRWAISTAGRDRAGMDALAGRLEAAARTAGIDPAAVRRRVALPGRVSSRATGYLEGPPADWVTELAHLVSDLGFSVLLADPPAGDRYSAMNFPSQIVPGLRRQLGTPLRPDLVARASAATDPTHGNPTQGAPERAGSWGESGGLPVGRRPVAPPIDPRRFTPVGLQNARWLGSLHEHLREELREVRATAAAVAEGDLSAGQGRAALQRTAQARRRSDLARECALFSRELEGHHGSEDAAMFPTLTAAEPALGPVVQRLVAEHRVIADRLDQLDQLLVEILQDPDSAAAAAAVTRLRTLAGELEPMLDSHLAYEEDQLGDGLRLVPTVL